MSLLTLNWGRAGNSWNCLKRRMKGGEHLQEALTNKGPLPGSLGGHLTSGQSPLPGLLFKMIQVFLILIGCIGASYPQNTTENEEWNGIVNAPATFNRGRPGHGGHGGGHGGGRPHGGGWNTPDICPFSFASKTQNRNFSSGIFDLSKIHLPKFVFSFLSLKFQISTKKYKIATSNRIFLAVEKSPP